MRPDRLEVSDRFTLRWTGRWARSHGVPAVMVSHESLVALFRMAPLGWGSRPVADWLNRRHQGARVLVCGIGFLLGAPAFAVSVTSHSLVVFTIFINGLRRGLDCSTEECSR